MSDETESGKQKAESQKTHGLMIRLFAFGFPPKRRFTSFRAWTREKSE